MVRAWINWNTGELGRGNREKMWTGAQQNLVACKEAGKPDRHEARRIQTGMF